MALGKEKDVEDMDDDELAAELDGMEDEDLAEARIYCEQIQKNIDEEKKKAIKEKGAGNTT